MGSSFDSEELLFQVSIFGNNRDNDRKMSKFSHNVAAADARAMTIPGHFLRKQPS